jgi:hypothetical protein
MSVLMALAVNGDPRKLEEHAASDPDAMQAILDSAQAHGLIAHRFDGSEDGQIMASRRWRSGARATEDRSSPRSTSGPGTVSTAHSLSPVMAGC